MRHDRRNVQPCCCMSSLDAVLLLSIIYPINTANIPCATVSEGCEVLEALKRLLFVRRSSVNPRSMVQQLLDSTSPTGFVIIYNLSYFTHRVIRPVRERRDGRLSDAGFPLVCRLVTVPQHSIYPVIASARFTTSLDLQVPAIYCQPFQA